MNTRQKPNSVEDPKGTFDEKSPQDPRENQILGFWTLRDWNVIFFDQKTRPYSDQQIGGFLHYSPYGKMSVSLFETEKDVLVTTYGGDYLYKPDENKVIHHALVGNSPAGLSEPKTRYVTFKDQTLVLETDWILEGEERFKYRLQWEKMP